MYDLVRKNKSNLRTFYMPRIDSNLSLFIVPRRLILFYFLLFMPIIGPSYTQHPVYANKIIVYCIHLLTYEISVTQITTLPIYGSKSEDFHFREP